MVDPTGGATAKLHQSQQGTLPGLLGFEWLRLDKETVEGRFDVRKATAADSISALICDRQEGNSHGPPLVCTRRRNVRAWHR